MVILLIKEPSQLEKERAQHEFLIYDILNNIERYSRYFGVSVADVLDIVERELIGEHEEVFRKLDGSRFIGMYLTTRAKGTHQRRITIPAQISPNTTQFYAYRTGCNGVRFEPVTDIQGRFD